MNTKILAFAAVAAFTFTSFAAEPLLSPRAAGNQIKVVTAADASSPAISTAYVQATPATLSPRAAGNQIKVAKGVSDATNPALTCRNTMAGTPRAVAECTSHANMPACKTVATLK